MQFAFKGQRESERESRHNFISSLLKELFLHSFKDKVKTSSLKSFLAESVFIVFSVIDFEQENKRPRQIIEKKEIEVFITWFSKVDKLFLNSVALL